MLSDRDRVFLNLYGQGDWGLAGARKRGSWDGTKAVFSMIIGREHFHLSIPHFYKHTRSHGQTSGRRPNRSGSQWTK